MSDLVPLNDYVILELIEQESKLSVPGQSESQKARIVNTGIFDVVQTIEGRQTRPLQVNDVVYFVKFSADGQEVEVDGKQLLHVKYDRLMSVEQ